jgi:hypothetical protein
MTEPVEPYGRPAFRVYVDLSDGINRTYDVTRYSIEHGVLRLFAPVGESGDEIEVAAFAVGGWLRVERDLTPDLR